MTIFTYSRVSTLDQNTDMQVEALKAAYPDAVHRQEKKSGTTGKIKHLGENPHRILKSCLNSKPSAGRFFPPGRSRQRLSEKIGMIFCGSWSRLN
ncbi:MAG: hypothetical protein RBR67_21385 [Desulfobacterium sp.]|nr:hypothetical protein [Desulfobacterium sp.]